MCNDEWYYSIGGQVNGPVSKKEVIKKYHENSDLKMYFWLEGMETWRQLEELPVLHDDPSWESLRKEQENIFPEELSVSPWLRYWARQLDLFLGSVCFVFLEPEFFINYPALFSFVLLIFWVFTEAVLLSTWGSTPGKFLLNISVRSHEGDILSFEQSLKRSFLVWLRGMGCGLPFAQVFAMFFSYRKLMRDRSCYWDDSLKVTVLQKRVSKKRVGLLLLIFTSVLLFLIKI